MDELVLRGRLHHVRALRAHLLHGLKDVDRALVGKTMQLVLDRNVRAGAADAGAAVDNAASVANLQ